MGSRARTQLFVIAVGAVIAAGAISCGKVPVRTAWYDLPTGEALARAENKPAILFFGADWSFADVRMERETFTDPEVRALLRDFIAIKVDMTDTDDAVALAAERRFNVVGDPTTIVIGRFDRYPTVSPHHRYAYDENPHDLYRAMTFVKAPEFASALREAKLSLDGGEDADGKTRCRRSALVEGCAGRDVFGARFRSRDR